MEFPKVTRDGNIVVGDKVVGTLNQEATELAQWINNLDWHMTLESSLHYRAVEMKKLLISIADSKEPIEGDDVRTELKRILKNSYLDSGI